MNPIKFELYGTELIIKEVRKQGTGAMIYLPSTWVSEKVAVIRSPEVKIGNQVIPRKIVYSYYVCDVLHKGHLLQMLNAKAMAGKDGISVVGILTDKAVMEKKPKPAMGFYERLELAQAIRYNDIVMAQETYSPKNNIEKVQPDIVMESDSHNKKEVKEITKQVESYGGRVLITTYLPGFSSTKIKEGIKNGNCR